MAGDKTGSIFRYRGFRCTVPENARLEIPNSFKRVMLTSLCFLISEPESL